MSTDNKILPPLPPRPVVTDIRRWVDKIMADPGNMELIRPALQLLAENPGLARTDAAWRVAFPDIDPIICTAAKACAASHIVVDCLQRGSSPMACDSEGTPALHTLMSHSFDEETIKALKLALKHPDCARLDALDKWGRTVPEAAELLMYKGNFTESDQEGRSIFQTILERTPRDLLRDKMSLLSLFGPGFATFSPGGGLAGDIVYVARLLADHGVDLDKVKITGPDIIHPFTELARKGDKQDAAGLLAAGLNEGRLCVRDPFAKKDSTIGEYLDGSYPHFKKTNGKKIRAEARKILKEHANEMTTGRISPREALISPYGCANWQAQGLLMQGMLMPLFGKKHAALFGGREQQLAFAGELDALFPPHQEGYFNLAGLLRDEPLARPSESATVEYLRGTSSGQER